MQGIVHVPDSSHTVTSDAPNTRTPVFCYTFSASAHACIMVEAKWTPNSPEEKAYYNMLFALADVSNGGKLGGDSVVPFLAKSGLGFDVLKEVSTIASGLGTCYDDSTLPECLASAAERFVCLSDLEAILPHPAWYMSL